MTPEEQAAAQLATEIATIRRAQEDAGGKLADLTKAIETMRSIQHQQSQDAAAAARLATEQRTGTRNDLGGYVAKAADVPADPASRAAYRVAGSVAVRMVGGFEQRRLPNGQAVDTWREGLLTDPNPRSREQLELQRRVTERSLARMSMAPALGHEKNWTPYTPRLDSAVIDAARACGGEVEKIFSDSTGIGAEWIPDTYVPEMDRQIVVKSGFMGIFEQKIMPPGGIKIPSLSGNLRVRKHAAPTADDPAAATLSSLTTGNTQVDPVDGVVAVQIDRNSSEDSIFAVIPELMTAIMDAIEFARDDTATNGDTTATHQDAIASWNARGRLGSVGLGGTDDHRRRYMGLRRRSRDLTSMTTDGNAVQTWAGLQAAIGKISADNLITAHSNPTAGNVVIAPSWEYFFAKMLNFDQFISWDKVGALASVLTGKLGGTGGMLPGQVGFVQGFLPVVIPYTLTADLASTGLYTGSGTTTSMLIVDRSRFEYRVRQGVTVESQTDIRTNTVTLVARFRDVFRAKDAVASTVKDVHYSYNLTF